MFYIQKILRTKIPDFMLRYLTFIIHGYQSCFYVANGKEPLLTFPSGLIADTMDMSMALTTDYIFVQGKNKIQNMHQGISE